MVTGVAGERVPREWTLPALTAAVFAGLVVAGIVWFAGRLGRSDSDFVGGCAPFNVHAQNEFDPFGTLIWSAPSPTAENAPGFSPNQLITVDGWVRTRSPYLTNPEPFNSDAWFHLANEAGWVSYAGIRADPTAPPPDGNFGTGTAAVPLDPDCRGSYRSS